MGSGSPASPPAAALLRKNRRGALQTAQLPPPARAFWRRGQQGHPGASRTQGDLLLRQPHPKSSHSISTWRGTGTRRSSPGRSRRPGLRGFALADENPALATPGGSQCVLERVCAASQPNPTPPPQVSTARCCRAAPHLTPLRILVPILNPIADRGFQGCIQQKPRQTDTPIPGAGTQVGSGWKGVFMTRLL